MKRNHYFAPPGDIESTDQRALNRAKPSLRHNNCFMPVLVCFLTTLLGASLAIHFYNSPNEDKPWAEEITVWMQEKTAQTFFLHDEYVSGSISETNNAWNALSPEGKGWVILEPQQNPFFMEMSKNDVAIPQQGACLSVFHQLHCLNKIRVVMSWLLENRGELPANISDQASHMKHCYDYLRQSVMCAADVTPEWVQPGENVTYGWGYTHQCRNFEELKRWAQKKRVKGLPANLD